MFILRSRLAESVLGLLHCEEEDVLGTPLSSCKSSLTHFRKYDMLKEEKLRASVGFISILLLFPELGQ